ncbi:MAG: DUF4296 domain-containing protein [Sphingobacteriales bacterium]|nr:MAG: DUF4296 domain-containing protein [Sphingobacteriales bacterium]
MRNGLLCLLLGLLSACGTDTPPLPEDQMAALLTDVHLAEVRATQIPDSLGEKYMGRNLDSLAVYYQAIFRHHQLDETRFRKALDWYLAHPAALDSAYKKAVVGMDRQLGSPPPPPSQS